MTVSFASHHLQWIVISYDELWSDLLMVKGSYYAKQNMFHCSLLALPFATHASMSFIKEEADAVH